MWIKNGRHENWYTGGILINMEEVINKLEKKQRIQSKKWKQRLNGKNREKR